MEPDIDPLMWRQAENALHDFRSVWIGKIPAQPRKSRHSRAAVPHGSHVLCCLGVIDSYQEIATRWLRGCEIERDVLADPAVGSLRSGDAGPLVAEHEPRDAGEAVARGNTGAAGDRTR